MIGEFNIAFGQDDCRACWDLSGVRNARTDAILIAPGHLGQISTPSIYVHLEISPSQERLIAETPGTITILAWLYVGEENTGTNSKGPGLDITHIFSIILENSTMRSLKDEACTTMLALP